MLRALYYLLILVLLNSVAQFIVNRLTVVTDYDSPMPLVIGSVPQLIPLSLLLQLQICSYMFLQSRPAQWNLKNLA